MPTQEEIDDVLTKVATYQTASTADDAAQRASNLASAHATGARQHWNAAIANGVTDEEKLTDLLNDLLDAETDSATKQDAAQTTGQAKSTANNAINSKIDQILHPPPPEP